MKVIKFVSQYIFRFNLTTSLLPIIIEIFSKLIVHIITSVFTILIESTPFLSSKINASSSLFVAGLKSKLKFLLGISFLQAKFV